jgi:two-component system sensor histidine kinase AlgZ
VTWISHSNLAYFDIGFGYTHIESYTLSSIYLRNIAISSIVSLILLYHLYLQSRWKQQVQAELNARLQALQSRIQPHFLFNSLNTIASTVHSDPDLAENLLVHMSELMRAGLNTQQSLVTLTDELRLVHSYLNIESQRVGDRLNVEWDVDKLVCNAQIPPLSLQPLVENAVYHGIEPSIDGGTVQIIATKREQSVILMVRNSVAQDNQQDIFTEGHGIALDNVAARVKGWFGDEGKVVFSTVDGWFQARIIIPYVGSI